MRNQVRQGEYGGFEAILDNKRSKVVLFGACDCDLQCLHFVDWYLPIQLLYFLRTSWHITCFQGSAFYVDDFSRSSNRVHQSALPLWWHSEKSHFFKKLSVCGSMERLLFSVQKDSGPTWHLFIFANGGIMRALLARDEMRSTIRSKLISSAIYRESSLAPVRHAPSPPLFAPSWHRVHFT